MSKGLMTIAADTTVTADIRGCERLEVAGYFEGDLIAEELIVHEGGHVYGSVRAGSADIRGTVQGTVVIRNLVSIRSTADVSGNLRYGSMAMEAGGSLSAEVRNVPPRLIGDFSVTVPRGGSVRLTPLDIAAIDPDNAPSELTFQVSNPRGGHVALGAAPDQAVSQFTQADLAAGAVVFRHDGSAGRRSAFDVTVRDAAGATSGAPRSVDVKVSDGAAA